MTVIASWQKKEVRQIGEVVTGTTPSTKKPEYYGDEYKLISPADLDNGKYVTTAHRMLSALGLEHCRVLLKDTVLVGCIGNVGKIGMVADEKVATNQQINAIICNQDHDPHFVYYSLHCNRQKLEKAAVKTTVPILNKSNFARFNLDVPPLPEQRRIAHVLTTVQTAIEQQARLIALFSELKTALTHKLFAEGVRGEKQKETEIGLVPESWEIVKLRGAVEYIDYGYTGNYNDKPLLKEFHIGEKQEKAIRKNFAKFDELPKILIITEKLLTGFDAPILYAMYLDKPMRDHTLLQAIARVKWRQVISP